MKLEILPPCLAARCPVTRPGGGVFGDKHRTDPAPHGDLKTYQLRMHFRSPQFAAVQTPSVCPVVCFLSVEKWNRTDMGAAAPRHTSAWSVHHSEVTAHAGLVGGKPDTAWGSPVTPSRELSPGSIRVLKGKAHFPSENLDAIKTKWSD